MKQITSKQAENLALKDEIKLKYEIKYSQHDWIIENASYIADIETKRSDKTLFGEWPKGWKAQMVKDSAEAAKAALLSRFLRDECKLLDGAIWLGNWQMIQDLERGSA
jgi:hypothetical protein